MTGDNPENCGTCPLIFNAPQCSVLCERHDPNVIKIRQHEAERRVWLPKYGNAIVRDNRRN